MNPKSVFNIWRFWCTFAAEKFRLSNIHSLEWWLLRKLSTTAFFCKAFVFQGNIEPKMPRNFLNHSDFRLWNKNFHFLSSWAFDVKITFFSNTLKKLGSQCVFWLFFLRRKTSIFIVDILTVVLFLKNISEHYRYKEIYIRKVTKKFRDISRSALLNVVRWLI